MNDDQRLAQLEEKLDDLTEIAEENNHILRSMQRTARWSFWGRLLIWIIVLVLPFIVLSSFLKTLVPSLSGTDVKSLFGLPSEQQIQSLIHAYESGTSTPAR